MVVMVDLVKETEWHYFSRNIDPYETHLVPSRFSAIIFVYIHNKEQA